MQRPPAAAQPSCRCRRPVATAVLQLRRQAGTGRRRQQLRAAAAAWEPEAAAAGSNSQPGRSLADAKAALLYAVGGTERGGGAAALQRGLVEEAQVGAAHRPCLGWLGSCP